MSLVIPVACALAAAAAYGASTAVEHSVAHSIGAEEGGNGVGALMRLVRNPRWLLGMVGDGLGLLLQVIALFTGPVVLVQPLLVLALPISLPIAWWLGGPKPGLAQYRACALIFIGLGAFFLIVRNPGDASAMHVRPAIVTIAVAVVVGLVALAAVYRRRGAVKAAVYGGVAGAWFGLVAVLLDAAAGAWHDHGLAAFAHVEGLLPLIALVVIGAASIALTQVAFQAGALAASFPANLAADPVVAVALGALLLYEDVPFSPLTVLAYLLCLAAIVVGGVLLAADPSFDPGEAQAAAV